MKILDVAKFIFDTYYDETGDKIDEMKLHKLLYFAQREHLAITDKPLFEEKLRGWKYGPVSTDVRSVYTSDGIYADTFPLTNEEMYILKNVILEYGQYTSWKLSEMTHKETSWLNSRKGLSNGEIGSKVIELEDIKKDAAKIRPYDHIWDMYYDEFEDAE